MVKALINSLTVLTWIIEWFRIARSIAKLLIWAFKAQLNLSAPLITELCIFALNKAFALAITLSVSHTFTTPSA